VILPDSNLLIYAVDTGSPSHHAARTWLERQLSGNEAVAFAWVTLLTFLRLTTRFGVFTQPLTIEEAFGYTEEWLDQPSAVVVHPGPRHQALLREMVDVAGTAGNLVTDAHLAALALEHGAVLATADRDFGRFPRLRVMYPLGSR
jgi:toxin-antitoxin system PIN domain toxin